MVWSQYVAETHLDEVNNDDEDICELNVPYNIPLEYDDWVTWFSDDLHNMWWTMRQYLGSRGNTNRVLDRCDYDNFCRFCYNFSCQYRSDLPS